MSDPAQTTSTGSRRNRTPWQPPELHASMADEPGPSSAEGAAVHDTAEAGNEELIDLQGQGQLLAGQQAASLEGADQPLELPCIAGEPRPSSAEGATVHDMVEAGNEELIDHEENECLFQVQETVLPEVAEETETGTDTTHPPELACKVTEPRPSSATTVTEPGPSSTTTITEPRPSSTTTSTEPRPSSATTITEPRPLSAGRAVASDTTETENEERIGLQGQEKIIQMQKTTSPDDAEEAEVGQFPEQLPEWAPTAVKPCLSAAEGTALPGTMEAGNQQLSDVQEQDRLIQVLETAPSDGEEESRICKISDQHPQQTASAADPRLSSDEETTLSRTQETGSRELTDYQESVDAIQVQEAASSEDVEGVEIGRIFYRLPGQASTVTEPRPSLVEGAATPDTMESDSEESIDPKDRGQLYRLQETASLEDEELSLIHI